MKKLFEKAKLEIKFRKAGDGHTLAESKEDRPSTSHEPSGPVSREPPAPSAQRAGQAALERFAQHEKAASKKPQSAKATWKNSAVSRPDGASSEPATAIDFKKLQAEARQELGKQQATTSSRLGSVTSNMPPADKEDSSLLSVEGIFLCCPLCASPFLYKDRDVHLIECLENKYTEDPHSSAAQMIQTLNRDKERVKACVDILCRYIDNICKNPGDEKFRKIKQSNRIFQEKVLTIKGAVEFLVACGFESSTIPVEDKQEQFYVLSEDKSKDTETLDLYKGILISVEPLQMKLDRRATVYKPSSQAMKFELPEEFFSLSSEEVKREYQMKLEEREKNAQLRTKAMREADKKPTKTYRFTLIRVRFPDGIVLQGTFYSREKLKDLREFVSQSLKSDWLPFVLSEPTGQLTNEEATFSELGLVPAAVVNFAWDAAIMADIAAASGSVQQEDFLNEELMTRIQDMAT
ncbi:UBX domain-containing protein 6-like isoform X2 [Nematostella vectensis]|uniref:UBX domain-containing protein 6-like isoform X2 n=1 Tax=Nematostella vectensis TaxID=45351 RepID=UPI0020774CF4|nr:UBX domain-containing protein 6-like isoform X2 [Nematostella vectensis]